MVVRIPTTLFSGVCRETYKPAPETNTINKIEMVYGLQCK